MSGSIAILMLLIVLCLVIKWKLYHKLANIDGFNGVHTEDLNKTEEHVLGYLGNE